MNLMFKNQIVLAENRKEFTLKTCYVDKLKSDASFSMWNIDTIFLNIGGYFVFSFWVASSKCKL